MGTLRLFLALSVLVSHTGPLFGLHLLPAFEAVRIFFAISGFYMALVLSGKYAGRPGLFYSNRALRIYPTYWLSVAVTLPLLSYWPLDGLDAIGTVRAILVNFTLFGADALYLTRHGSELVVPPAWSLGAEVLFYALAPWLAQRSTRTLVAMMVAGFAVQIGVDAFVRPMASYFLFPANLWYFLYGMLAFRLTQTDLFDALASRWGRWIAGGALTVLVLRELIPFFRNYEALHLAVALPALPFIFRMSSRWPLDRAVGELSYPIYILHFAAVAFSVRYLGGPSVWWALAITLPASISVHLLLERPLERWRARRADGGGSGLTALGRAG